MIHAPRSLAGRMVWALAMRCGGQLRVTQGAVVGYDMTAVMAMGAALGAPLAAVAEFMPLIEQQMVAAAAQAAQGQGAREPGDDDEG